MEIFGLLTLTNAMSKMRLGCFFFTLLVLADSGSQVPVSPAASAGQTSHVEIRVGNGHFDPEHPKPVSYQDNDMSLRLRPEGETLSIVLSRGGGEPERIVLPKEIAQVDSIRRVGRASAVVLAMINGSASEVVVLGLDRLSIKDKFLAYNPSVSPDGRWASFVKFYPSHFVDGPTDEYMLYDLASSARENRPAGVALSDSTNVGILFFPPHAINRDGGNTGVPEGQIHHMASESFSWAPNSGSFLFADEYAGNVSAILVAVRGGKPKLVGELGISKDGLCGTATEACGVQLRSAEFEPSGIQALFSGTGTNASLKKTIVMAFDKFSPIQ
jgi:hypothetical protein